MNDLFSLCIECVKTVVRGIFMLHSERRILPVFFILALGLLTGCVLPKLLCMGTGTYAGLSSLYSFQVYENISLNLKSLFFYVVSVRLRTLLFLWMSGFTTIGFLFHLGYAWWITASGAMLLSLFGLRSGYQGLLHFCCCLFPQWILYAILWKKETAIWMQRKSGIFGLRDGVVEKIRKRDIAELGNLVLLCLLGCACEAFLGTWTLRFYLQL
ncbi:MAG: hypothetical protein LUH07_02890 [Lachnospiraceae bacterium]|nr:hypothetical protein [Lachnospiraceae bacterium]